MLLTSRHKLVKGEWVLGDEPAHPRVRCTKCGNLIREGSVKEENKALHTKCDTLAWTYKQLSAPTTGKWDSKMNKRLLQCGIVLVIVNRE